MQCENTLPMFFLPQLDDRDDSGSALSDRGPSSDPIKRVPGFPDPGNKTARCPTTASVNRAQRAQLRRLGDTPTQAPAGPPPSPRFGGGSPARRSRWAAAAWLWALAAGRPAAGAGPAADDLDRDTRFPAEAVDALGAEGMLSSLVPTRLGGEGAHVRTVAAGTAALARHYPSTAMV